MNIRITKTEYTQDPEWLLSEHKVHRPGGVTIDSSKVAAGTDGRKIVKAGTPIGMNDAGKWEPYNGDPDEPNVVPTDLLFNTVDVTDGDEAAGSIIHGFVNVDRLPDPSLIDTRVRVNMPMIAFLSYTTEGQLGDLFDEITDAVTPENGNGEG